MPKKKRKKRAYTVTATKVGRSRAMSKATGLTRGEATRIKRLWQGTGIKTKVKRLK